MATSVWGAISLRSRVIKNQISLPWDMKQGGGKIVTKQDELVGGMSCRGKPWYLRSPGKLSFHELQCRLYTFYNTLPKSDLGRMLSLWEDEGDSDRG